jgi:hypothetical protein
MTILGIMGRTEAEEAAEVTKASSLRAEVAKRVALGGGWSIGAAVVFGAYDLLRTNPRDAFPLLMSWGPKAIGTIIVIYVSYDLAKIVLNLVSRLVHSVEKLAVAQQKLADKDDRQVQEMQTLTAYTSQQSEKTYQKISEIPDLIAGLTTKFTAAIDSLNVRIDGLTATKRDG